MVHIYPNWEGFEWDDGNKNKNFIKHRVRNAECERIFFNEPLIILEDEKRFFAFGQTDQKRKLLVVFTLRKKRIRIISARDMHQKERKFYETCKKTHS